MSPSSTIEVKMRDQFFDLFLLVDDGQHDRCVF